MVYYRRCKFSAYYFLHISLFCRWNYDEVIGMSTQEMYTQLENLYPTFSNTLREKCIEYCTKYSISSLVTDLNASNIHLQSFIRGIIDIDKLYELFDTAKIMRSF